MTTTVVHCAAVSKYIADLPDYVYIGRPTKWGNPFKIGLDGDREQVIAKYREWITQHPDLTPEVIRAELHDKRLGCWCAPKACHGDVLAEIANNAFAQSKAQAERSE